MLLSMVVIFGFTSLCPAQDKNIVEKCFRPTVMVIDQGEKASASGFVVRSEKNGNSYRNTVITARHAVDGPGPFFVKSFSYSESCEILKSDEARMFLYDYDDSLDLAVGVYESSTQPAVAHLAYGVKKAMGDKVHHVGFGLSDDARIDYGIITQPKTVEPSMFAGKIRTNAYAISGDSGGPLFDEKNRVIGICHGIRTHGQQLLTHQSYFGDVDTIKKWAAVSDNSIEFVYNHNVKMPILPFIKLKLQDYKYQVPQE